MKSVLITGSSGFIAPHIIKKALERKYKVFGIDIKNPEIKIKGCNYIKKDVRDFNIEEIGNLDYIIHLAFVTNIPFSISDPISTTEDNILMTSNLLKKATDAKVKKFIFSSVIFPADIISKSLGDISTIFFKIEIPSSAV